MKGTNYWELVEAIFLISLKTIPRSAVKLFTFLRFSMDFKNLRVFLRKSKQIPDTLILLEIFSKIFIPKRPIDGIFFFQANLDLHIKSLRLKLMLRA